MLRKGRYEEMSEVRERERRALKEKRKVDEQKVKQLRREIQLRKIKADTADQKLSKKGISKKDHDAKAKIDLARLSGKDGVAGKLYKQLSGRLNQAEDRVRQIRVEKEYETGIWLEGSFSRRNTLVCLTPGHLAITHGKAIEHGRITVLPRDKIGIVGRNGAGKSYFLTYLARQLRRVIKNVLYIPQELTEKQMKTTLDDIRGLPSHTLGQIMTIVQRLGSNPKRLFDADAGSPGEVKKLLLAEAVIQRTQVILLDEPVNHLDLLSVESLESSLSDYPGCLICVSHDMDLLDRVTKKRWEFKRREDQHGWVTRIVQS